MAQPDMVMVIHDPGFNEVAGSSNVNLPILAEDAMNWVILDRLKETGDFLGRVPYHLDIMFAFCLCSCRSFQQRTRRALKNKPL
jgi:hypothetical protein